MQLPHGLPAAVMAPAWCTKKIKQPFLPAGCTPEVAPQVNPLMRGNNHRIVGFEVMQNAVVRAFFLLGKRTEELVPDDEDTTVIFIQIFDILAMMDAVVRWGVENPLQRAEPVDGFGMDPKLVQQADRLHGQDHQRREAEQGQPKPEDKAGENACPGLPQCCGKVIVLRRVMYHMRGPEKTRLVTDAMKPVIGKIFEEKQRHPGLPASANIEQPELIDEKISAENHGFGHKLEQHIADAHGQACSRIAQFIKITLIDSTEDSLDDHQHDKRRDCVVD